MAVQDVVWKQVQRIERPDFVFGNEEKPWEQRSIEIIYIMRI